MAENTLYQSTSLINENGMEFLEAEGEILFSSEEVGRQLGYQSPAKSVNILYNRNRKELKGYERHINLMSRDGQSREVRHFTEEGVYILSMLASTPHAAEFRARLARLLHDIREQRLSLAYQQGLAAARALPASESDRKAAYLDGMKEGQRLQKRLLKRKDGLATLERALSYQAKGINLADTAKLVGVPATTLRGRMQRLRQFLASPAQTGEEQATA